MTAAVGIAPLDRAHGRAPQQGRSRRTMARIVAAAEALFAERGFDGTSVHDIVARAGCSIGTFYARFTDKESLFLHLHETQCRAMIEGVDRLVEALPADAPLAEVVPAVIDAQYCFAERRRALTREFIQRSGHDAAFHARYAEAWGDVAARLRDLLLARRDEIGHRDPAVAARFAVQMLHAGWANDVLHHDRREITGGLSPARRRAELAEACLAYLGVTR